MPELDGREQAPLCACKLGAGHAWFCTDLVGNWYPCAEYASVSHAARAACRSVCTYVYVNVMGALGIVWYGFGRLLVSGRLLIGYW